MPAGRCVAVADDIAPAATVLALGDSYTIGEGVDAADSWPVQLVSLLSEKKGRALPPPRILATTGWTTDELAAALTSAPGLGSADTARERASPFRLVFLSVGVNDQYRGRSLERFRTGFADLLKSAVALAGNDPARVIVVSIPDWSRTPFALSRGADRARNGAAIDSYNEAKQAACESAGVTFVDITALTREAAPEEYAPDGLHPGPTIYRRWAQRLTEPAMTVLERATHA